MTSSSRHPPFLKTISRPRQSLEGWLVVSFLALSLMTVSLLAGVAYLSSRASLTEALRDQLLAISSLKEGELNRWVEAQEEILGVVTLLPGVRSGAQELDSPFIAERLHFIAETVAGSGRDLQEVFFMDEDGGRVVASSEPGREGDFHASDFFFLNGRERPTMQPVHPSREEGRPQITVAVPVLSNEETVGAVLAAHLSMDRMDEIVEAQLGTFETAEGYLVTGTNEFVSAARFGLPDFRRGVHSPGIDSAMAGGTGVAVYKNYAGEPVVGAFRWMPSQELALMVEVTTAEAFKPARNLLLRIFLFGLGASLLLTLGVRWIAATVTRPILAVESAAAKVADGDFGVLAPEDREDELGSMGRSFNLMTSRLRTLYQDLQGQIEISEKTVVALEESRSLLRSILDTSTALIAVTEPDGKVQLMNRAFLHLLDQTTEKVEGRHLANLLPEEIRTPWMEAKVEAFQEQRVVELEVPWETAGGVRTYLCVWFPLTDDGPKPFGVGMIATDLTERKKVEEERLRFEAQLRHAQKLESLGVLAGGIAHDFNNILAAILGHADLAAEVEDGNIKEVRKHLEQVVAASQRAADLTNQMLAYAGRATFRVKTLDLNEAIQEMSSFMAVSLPKKVRLVTRLSKEPLPVLADPAQLSQVVMNLITNAAQAMGHEAGSVEVSTVASVPGWGPARALLRVKDTGCGMDAETREKIFDPFFSTKETGRGLGLAAVLGIVNGLDGTIEVESEPGEGTTFTVLFPLHGMESQGSRVAEEVEPPRALEEGAHTVLVVDDEEAVRSFSARTLERKGLRVLQAEDGLRALEILGRIGHGIDLVVLDLSMPGMGGQEVFERLRVDHPELPVIFTSGYDPSDATTVASDDTQVRFLQKPYRPSVLMDQVHGILGE